MDLEPFFAVLPELSAGVVALLVLAGVLCAAVWLASKLITGMVSSFKDELDNARKERENNQAVFMDFVQSNNHKVTELVQSSTAAITESTLAIRASSLYIGEATKALTVYNDRMKYPRRK